MKLMLILAATAAPLVILGGITYVADGTTLVTASYAEAIAGPPR